MSKIIDEKTLEYLADLSKIKIDKRQEGKLLKDVGEILAYFEQLNDLDTESVRSMNRGTENKNVFSDDSESARAADFKKNTALDDFPEREEGFLKIPPVFEK